MTRVLVTGGNGGLGREVVAQLHAAGYMVRVMSRSAAPAAAPAGLEWAVADLATGAGLSAALEGVDVVVHAASSPARNTRAVDVDGTRRLLKCAHQARVAHLVYVSIVGCDQVSLAYYRAKTAAEALVRDGGVPWSIVRATQFHSLIDGMLRRLARLPLFVVPPDLLLQPIDTCAAAARLAESVAAGPAGRLPDIGGPEVLRLGDMAREWLAAQGRLRRIIAMPLPGAVAAAVRRGILTCPGQHYGHVTWAEWLRASYATSELARRPVGYSVQVDNHPRRK